MQCNSLHFDTLKLQMLCHRNGLVSRDSNSTPVCQYKQGPLTLRAICPIQERRWRRHPILRGGGASEKAGEGGPGGSGPAPRRHARGREVFTFNYGSKRVLTQSMYRGRESTAREGTLQRERMQYLLLQSLSSLQARIIHSMPMPVCPRPRMG